MKRFINFLGCILIAAGVQAATIQTYDDGLGNISWSTDGGASSCGCTPADGDDIIVDHTITLAGDFILETGSLTINNGGFLTVSPGDLDIGQGGFFGGSATLRINAGGRLDIADDFRSWRNSMIVEAGAELNIGDSWTNGTLMDPVIDGTVNVGGDLINIGVFVVQGDITGSGSISVAGTVFNAGTIGGSSDNDLGSLPVEMLYYTGKVDERGHAYLKWATAVEENFDYFTIERSYDGEEFEFAGILDGVGNSTDINYYEYTDEVKVKGNVYYRLKATDIDGFEEYHGMVMLQGEDSEAAVTLYPNPTNGDKLMINNSFAGFGDVELSIIEVSGRVVHYQKVGFGNNELKFQNPLEKGNYVVLVKNNDQSFQQKLIVK